MYEWMSELNAEQQQAVQSTEGYIRVVAGAGSGKTRALSYRFAYLVLELGVLPANILCVTFTNKSANEMRQRIRHLTGDSDTGYISTFHSFCVSVLQEDGYAVQYPKSFLVLDNSDIDAMLAIIYEERGLTLRDMSYSNARDMIEIRKLDTDPEYYREMLSMPLEGLKRKYDEAVEARDIIFWGYIYQEKKCFALDYNDLIKFVLYLFENNAAVRDKWQQRLEYIMVDEFQDIDGIQYRLMEVLAGYHRNLFVVGDPDQTIYTWRGANIKYLLEFDRKFPDVQTIIMNRNYRSSPQILSAANSLISKNTKRIEKNLLPILADGAQVVMSHYKTQEKEADGIASFVRELNTAGVKLADITVLYRAHYLSRSLEESFQKQKIAYRIYSGIRFYERTEIKNALAYLRFAAVGDDLAFARIANVPKRGLGERRMRYLRDYAEKNNCSLLTALRRTEGDEVMRGAKSGELLALVDGGPNPTSIPVSELLASLLEKSGYREALRTEGAQDRLDNLAELLQSVHEYETTCGEEATLSGYLARVALLTNADAEDGAEAVKFMTIHAAKGLEFPYVFLCGLNEGVFPSRKIRTPTEMEEERRLCFVALTRAEKGLFLSDSEGKNLDGSFRFPSRFIFDIGEERLAFTEPLDEGLVRGTRRFIEESRKTMEAAAGITNFGVGDRVVHQTFGEGVIRDMDYKLRAYVIDFVSLPTPRKISFHAKLTLKNG